MQKKYTLEEQAIINILKINSLVTQEDIAEQIGKSLRTVKTRMAEMQEKGFIEKAKGKKGWVIKI
jgi:DNA-binding Lrp family transcriptional regulator